VTYLEEARMIVRRSDQGGQSTEDENESTKLSWYSRMKDGHIPRETRECVRKKSLYGLFTANDCEYLLAELDLLPLETWKPSPN